jgi:hypothetical protein
MGPAPPSLGIAESKVGGMESRFDQIAATEWMETPGFEKQRQALGGVTATSYPTRVATESSVRPGIPVGIPANVSQVVDRMALGKSCAKPTENESWPTLGADCRVKTYKLPCVLASTGWVERILTVKELLLAWDLPATTIKNAAENVGKRLS